MGCEPHSLRPLGAQRTGFPGSSGRIVREKRSPCSPQRGRGPAAKGTQKCQGSAHGGRAVETLRIEQTKERTMSTNTKRTLVICMTAAMGLFIETGCATKNFVKKQV